MKPTSDACNIFSVPVCNEKMIFRKGRELFVGAFISAVILVMVAQYYFGPSLFSGSASRVEYVFAENGNNTPQKAIPFQTATSQVMSSSINNDPPEITVVTFYTNIGKFQKGTGSMYYTPDNYRTWMQTYGLLTNRVIGFFDNDETLEYFRKVRSSQPADKTTLLKIARTDLPAFQRLEKVKQIFQSPGYPKHPPNTVVPEYSCAMHAKYDAILVALSKGLIKTKYVAWLDIGLFRHLGVGGSLYTGKPFTLEVPETFNSSTIGMSEVSPKQSVANVNPHDYIYNNIVWVGGAFSLGTRENMKLFAESFRDTISQLVEQNLASTDQQTIGAMYSPAYVKQQKVDLVPHKCKEGQFGLTGVNGGDLAYFCLAYVCRDVGDRNQKMNVH